MTGAHLIPFDDLTPVATTRNASLVQRIDPFYGSLWSAPDGGVAVAWSSRGSTKRLADAGMVKPRAVERAWEKHEALALVPERRPRLEALAAISMWRAITSEQLAAITGRAGVGTGHDNRGTISVLWSAGLIHCGDFVAPRTRLRELPAIFRPASNEYMAPLEPLLTYRDWVGVTGSQRQPWGHHYDRHNLLTTELSLRAAELLPLIGVLGEGMASWSLIFDPSAGVPETSHRAADAVWIRADGLKIAIETTANVSALTTAKIQHAADYLAADKSRSTMVLFVNAADHATGNPTEVSKLLRMAIAKSAYSSRATIAANVAQRMALARWVDWFPEPRMVSSSFLTLAAQYPAKASPGANRFEWIDLLDPYALPGPEADTSFLKDNIALLYGVPHWQRRSPNPDLLTTRLLDHFGVPQSLRRAPSEKSKFQGRADHMNRRRRMVATAGRRREQEEEVV